LNWQGLENVLDRQQSTFELNWLNYLDKLEKNTSYERNYSTVYFKPVEESVEHCSCTGTDQEQVDDQRLKWVSNTNQFFNSTLIAETGFQSGSFETEVLDLEADDLKKLHSRLAVPYGESTSFDMDFYIGPNEFERLASYGLDLQDVVPFGRSIFGT
ncbi:MAG: YidC/Oxa1 family insertase periplasmic-domain containing protein, partial [Saprospiraceae bacterium]|nr:YidC/Oxa1 family insertase periplasmic-domain containing protein [Saprospiraceae bacterium]